MATTVLRIFDVVVARGRIKSWLAGQIGVSPPHLTRLMRGERPWTEEQRTRAITALGLSEEEAEGLFDPVEVEDGEG